MSRLLLLAVVATAVAVAGCGGNGGSGGDRLSEQEFASRLNTICADYNDFAESVEAPKSVAEIPDWIDEVLPRFEDAIADARALRPPEDAQRDANEFFSIADDEAQLLRDIRNAAEDGDEQEIIDLQQEGEALDDRSDEVARRLDADKCTE
jgi:outer membrane murein-binding lipoprotein Lpp